MSEREQKVPLIAELFGLTPEGPLFEQALTHPSFTHETPEVAHNQRLEFLGDAILDFVVSLELYERFPDAAEGKLTRTRAQLVNTAALSRFARHHEFSHVLRFGKGGAHGGLSDSENVLADAVEALIAASYLEGGLEATRRACLQVMEFGLDSLQEAGARDPKSELQEKVQAQGRKAPNYRVVSSTGPAHEVEFEVEVFVDQQSLATGSGRSKRLAERRAAEVALSRIEQFFSAEPPNEEA
jgi:ribonuclease-3